ncbi:dynamin family protein [Glycomyces sp. L485]|uniref:dynamin family protein n=1 Tax=Glycomyces sp. L485 TaxID=2909235 RepID=UPI001F4AA739|nr:dynamin family protein [Glycomyces sp. L485]MCH7230296.1 dynamin family protein [Glycomyces sp. L485]
MVAGQLTTSVASMCEELSGKVSDPSRAVVQEVAARLGQPLRVAVAGRLKAGKSTLVNALIGRRVAPTAAGECTRVVTQFRYGPADRVDVIDRAGRKHAVPLDATGMIPTTLPIAAEDAAMIDVQLSSDRLRDLMVVDTPGLQSINTDISETAREMLFAAPMADDVDDDSREAVAGAEAIIYVFTQQVRSDDVDALEAFAKASQQLSSSPMNSLALYNKADKLSPGPGRDPWPVAGPIAEEQAAILRRAVCDVVPVVGLLAETAEAGLLTAADCEALRTLAGLDEEKRALMLASAGLFTSTDGPVGAEQRHRLLERLDLYGIHFAIAHLQANPHLATGELVRLLFAASGFPRLRTTLHQVFGVRADVIKAGWALGRLEAAAAAGPAADRDLLRGAVESIVARPEYHRLPLLEAAASVTTGQVALPEDMEAEVARLALTDDPGVVLGLPDAARPQLRRSAIEAAARWRAFANGGATPAQARVANVVHRGFHLLAQRLG